MTGDASYDNYDEDDNLAENCCHIYPHLINDNRFKEARSMLSYASPGTDLQCMMTSTHK